MTPFKGKNRVTSPYGWRTLRGARQWHAGQDIVGDDDPTVRAIWNSVRCEVKEGWNGGRGNMVTLYYSAALRVICQHLGKMLVQNGTVVKQGAAIGVMGNTGDSLGAHLHIEVQVLQNGRWVAVGPAGYTEVPNTAGVHPGNNRVDGAQMLPAPPQETPAAELQVGDVVTFSGVRHYLSANGERSAAASPGPAHITRVAKGAAHPYHLVHQKEGQSTVYGWVDAADLLGRQPAPAETGQPPSGYKVGDKLSFSTGYLRADDGPEKALHLAKAQLKTGRGLVGAVLQGAKNPLKMLSVKDGKTPVCWCNDGDIRGYCR